MRQSQLFCKTKKEAPKEAEVISHKYLVRGDFIEQSFSGVYRFLPLGLRVLKKLEEIIERDPSGWIHGWVQDEQFLLAERIEEWITQPPLNARDDPDYWFDDDCPLCQLMRKIEEENRSPTLSETHETFKKAKEQGAWVGGTLLEGSEVKKERKWMEKKGFKYN